MPIEIASIDEVTRVYQVVAWGIRPSIWHDRSERVNGLSAQIPALPRLNRENT
jgi:hypothetical protein